MTAYDNSSAIATSTWAASVSGAQAYALVMEGYAAANATSGNGIFASSVSQSLNLYFLLFGFVLPSVASRCLFNARPKGRFNLLIP